MQNGWLPDQLTPLGSSRGDCRIVPRHELGSAAVKLEWRQRSCGVPGRTQAGVKHSTALLTKFKIKPLGTTQFAVVHAGLSKTKATALVKAIKIAKIGKPRVKKLA